MLVPAVPESIALHALTAGVMAAMVTRVTLGHAGRPLIAAHATTAIYLLVTLAAATRLAGDAGGRRLGRGIRALRPGL